MFHVKHDRSKSGAGQANCLTALTAHRSEDLRRCVDTLGPHREDLLLTLEGASGQDLRFAGSHLRSRRRPHRGSRRHRLASQGSTSPVPAIPRKGRGVAWAPRDSARSEIAGLSPSPVPNLPFPNLPSPSKEGFPARHAIATRKPLRAEFELPQHLIAELLLDKCHGSEPNLGQ